ncbi:hypothetical protein ACFO5R_18295 [Halosolutus amylolyticus]|uniref:Uncharacterized protein n=1 Tax=Halosolutus amylolyticus TaxID=2932267 RepID=A0ABD5PTG1_9EURY|nr:hypothetical protein [Halosolutus amylolyticus]
MRRSLLALAVFAVIEIAVPDRIVSRAERLAFENPESARLRAWTLPMARIEGLIALWLAWKWDQAWPGLRPLFGTVGLPALVLPDPVLDAAIRTAYQNADEIRPKPWVRPATRLLGLCYVLVAIWPAIRRSERGG